MVAETPISTPDQKEVRPWKLQNYVPMISTETVKDAADNAAYKLVDADNKCFLATQAMKEAERVSMMAEDTDSMLMLIEEIYEQCKYETCMCTLVVVSLSITMMRITFIIFYFCFNHYRFAW